MTAPRVASRPVQRSVFTDIASVGGGLAAGYMKEKERQRLEALEAATRAFDENIKTQQVGLQKQELALQEMANRATDQRAQAQLEISRQTLQANKDQFEIEKAQRAQEHADELEKIKADREHDWNMQAERLKNDRAIANIQSRHAGAGQLLTELRSMADDNARERKMIEDDPEFLSYMLDPVGTTGTIALELKSKDATTRAKAAVRQRKIDAYIGLQDQKKRILGYRGTFLSLRAGLPLELQETLPDQGEGATEWDRLSPEEQTAAPAKIAAMIGAAMAANPEVGEPLDRLRTLVSEKGFPPEVIAAARMQAGTLTRSPEQMGEKDTDTSALAREVTAPRKMFEPPQASPFSSRNRMPVSPNAPIVKAREALKSIAPKRPVSPPAPMPPLGQMPDPFGPQAIRGNQVFPAAPGGTLPRTNVFTEKNPKHRIQPPQF